MSRSGEWRALAFPQVTHDVLEAEFGRRGVPWQSATHFAATGSLADALRGAGVGALSISNFLDALVFSGLPAPYTVPIDALPTVAAGTDPSVLRPQLQSWANDVAGRRLRLGLVSEMRLRRHLATEAIDRDAADVVTRSLRQMRRSALALTAAGIGPENFDSDDPVVLVALGAWRHLLEVVPAVAAVREDLWFADGEFGEQSTRRAKDVRRRLDAALDQAFGPCEGRRTIVHHGFFFFTPQQWAFFQLLREHPAVDQWFVVHDDGSNRAFETWRHYFTERWNMPVPEPVALVVGDGDGRAAALRSALEGRPVEVPSEAGELRLVSCRTTVEFVRTWAQERIVADMEGRPAPVLYAPAPFDVERAVRRLDPLVSDDSADLADLPVGQFLLALHECIEVRGLQEPRLVLTRERLIDIVASGFVDGEVSAHLGAIRRAMPYFEDCTVVAEWVERAQKLHELVAGPVADLDEPQGGDADADRIARAAHNPLRTVPWCDLTVAEASAVGAALGQVARLLEAIVSAETVAPDRYLGWIRQQLQRGMENLSLADRSAVEARLHGAGLGDDEFDVAGLIDVVNMILGREPELGLDGADVESDGRVRPIDAVDALGLSPAGSEVHIANLVDGVFPVRVRSVQWPFHPGQFAGGDRRPPDVSVEILRVRDETAQLGSLYLFWLVLAGVAPDHRLTLSWVAEARRERRNMSPLVSTITQVELDDDDVRWATRGLVPISAQGTDPGPPDPARPTVRPWQRDEGSIREGIGLLDPIAAAAALACPRRLALQWVLGPSPAFGSTHHQAMLYGNVQGALAKAFGLSTNDAILLTKKEVWFHLTPGEHASSYKNRRVDELPAGTKWQWIWTLGGSQTGGDPTSLAYRAAFGGGHPEPTTVAPTDSGVLPARPDGAPCHVCPVRPRCLLADDTRS
jgi:hypothetical protein